MENIQATRIQIHFGAIIGLLYFVGQGHNPLVQRGLLNNVLHTVTYYTVYASVPSKTRSTAITAEKMQEARNKSFKIALINGAIYRTINIIIVNRITAKHGGRRFDSYA